MSVRENEGNAIVQLLWAKHLKYAGSTAITFLICPTFGYLLRTGSAGALRNVFQIDQLVKAVSSVIGWVNNWHAVVIFVGHVTYVRSLCLISQGTVGNTREAAQCGNFGHHVPASLHKAGGKGHKAATVLNEFDLCPPCFA